MTKLDRLRHLRRTRNNSPTLGAAAVFQPISHACPPSRPSFLPSANSAEQALSGDPVGWLKVIRDIGVRAIPIGVGLRLAGNEEGTVKKALYASVAVEAVVLFLAWVAKK